MLGHRHIRESIGYVTTGLFGCALSNELLEAKKNPGTVPKESKMIQILIDSFEGYKNPGSIPQERYRDLVFHKYQEFKTLYEALGLPGYPSWGDVFLNKLNKIYNVFEKIINPWTTPQKRYENIEKAIEFSSRLCKTALHNTEFALPDNYVPPGLAALVKN